MDRLNRVLLHLADRRRVAINPAAVFYLEAVGDETSIRTRSSRTLRDVRSLGEVFPSFERHGFLRVHHNHAVNLRRIREIRPRSQGDDWELRLRPPVNQILPISRDRLSELLGAFDDEGP